MSRISYEDSMLYIMNEIGRRECFYYTTPLFTSSKGEGKLDYILGQYQKREEIFEVRELK